MATSVNTSYQPTPRRAYISAIPFNTYFFTYIPANLNLNVPVLVPVPGASSSVCPVGRILHETGRKIYPGVNPGITTPMVAVYDNISLLSGFIDPNSAAFAVYSTDASYFAQNGVDPTTNQPDLGPAVITNVVAGSYIQPKLYVSGTGPYVFTQTLFPAGYTATTADVFVNPYLGTMFEININPVAQPFLQTINCYLRSSTAPNVDLVVPIGQTITILLSNMGGYTITMNFMEGITPPSYPGFYSGTPALVVPTTAVSVVSFALDGVEAYPVGSNGGGSTGPAGLTGPTGPTGSQGLQGVGGEAANTGATGTTGTTGAQGFQGFQGFQGIEGPQGFQGFQGFQGDQGFQGIAGSADATGATGTTGPQGIQGFQGFQGSAGTASLTGSTGPTGIQGGGSTGPTGMRGYTGPTGISALPGYGGISGGLPPYPGYYPGYFYLATISPERLFVWGGNSWGQVNLSTAPTLASPTGQNPHGLYQDAPQPPSTELYPGYTYYATDVFGLLLWDGNQYNIIATTPI